MGGFCRTFVFCHEQLTNYIERRIQPRAPLVRKGYGGTTGTILREYEVYFGGGGPIRTYAANSNSTEDAGEEICCIGGG